jgi:hypothetical protein
VLAEDPAEVAGLRHVTGEHVGVVGQRGQDGLAGLPVDAARRRVADHQEPASFSGRSHGRLVPWIPRP